MQHVIKINKNPSKGDIPTKNVERHKVNEFETKFINRISLFQGIIILFAC